MERLHNYLGISVLCRKKYPHLVLGISCCAKSSDPLSQGILYFFSPLGGKLPEGSFALDHFCIALSLGIIKISPCHKERHFSYGLTGTEEVEKVLLISRVRS